MIRCLAAWCFFPALLFAATLVAAPLDPPALPPSENSDEPAIEPDRRTPPPRGGGFWANDPRLQLPAVQLARKALEAGQPDECMRHLQAAADEEPALPPPELMLALMHLAENRWQPGIAALERASITEQTHPEAYLTAGQIALLQGRNFDAWVQLERALSAKRPGGWSKDFEAGFRVRCFQSMATIADRRRDWPRLEATLRNWGELEPENASLWDRWGRALLLSGRSAEALEKFGVSYKNDPAMNPPEVSMAAIHVEMGEYDMAETWYQKAVEKYADDPRVYGEYAFTLLLAGRIEEAGDMIDKAVDADEGRKQSAQFAEIRGLIARAEKDYAKAEQIFMEQLRQSPGDAQALSQLPRVLIEQQEVVKRDQALQFAQLFATKEPNSPAALSTLGCIQFRLGKNDEAEKSLRLAVSKGGTDPETLYYLAQVLVAQQKTKDAAPVVKALRQAVRQPGLFVVREDAKKWLDTVGLVLD